MALKCFDLGNPNPSTMGKLPCTTHPTPCFSSSASAFSLRIHSSRQSRSRTVSATLFSHTPRGLCGSALLPVRNRRSFLQLAASHEDSAPLDAEFEKGRSELEQGKQSDEAWEQVLAAFKEKTLKLQRMSQEAYESYLKTTMVVLKKAAKDLNIEAAKASYDISIIVQELGEEGRHYIALAAASSPEPLKDVVETFTSSENIKHVSEIRDFYVGVPYGAILSLGGFLDFMITGSTSAIRFGMILGGILLALSVSSLRSWRKGNLPDGVILKYETAIVGILFLRQFRLLFEKHRLHTTRRLSTRAVHNNNVNAGSTQQAPQFLVVGGIWVPPSGEAASTSGAPRVVYTPVARPSQQPRHQATITSDSHRENGARCNYPATSSSARAAAANIFRRFLLLGSLLLCSCFTRLFQSS